MQRRVEDGSKNVGIQTYGAKDECQFSIGNLYRARGSEKSMRDGN
jgi:hypothetical protein